MPSQQSLQISQQIKQAQLCPRLVSQCQALCTAGEHTDPLSTKLVSLITSRKALEAAECASLTYQASSSHLQARVFALLVRVLISRCRRQRTALSRPSVLFTPETAGSRRPGARRPSPLAAAAAFPGRRWWRASLRNHCLSSSTVQKAWPWRRGWEAL